MAANNSGRQGGSGGILSRLARDAGGNTLAMMAIALIPMSALAGSAIDTSRMYFVKVRLQQACDAGALAGRKFMVGTNYSTAANTQAQVFFENNFKEGTYGSTVVEKRFVKTADNQVAGFAKVRVPMTIMKMFDFDDDAVLEVTCEAKLEVPNLDVMFVLDTTGSMSKTNPTDSVSRIAALRTAVANFYDTLEAAKTASSQIRYGFVPYSSTVNVGMLLKREWMVDNGDYQSRQKADITSRTNTTTAPPYITLTDTNWQYVSGSKTAGSPTQGDPETCVAPSNTIKVTPGPDTGWVSDGKGGETRTWEQNTNGDSYSIAASCMITKTTYNAYRERRTQTRKPNPDAGKQTTTTTLVHWWNYKRVSYPVSALKGSLANGLMAGGSFKAQIAGGDGAAWSDSTITWNSGNACIEERETVRQSDYSPIPAGAIDLDIDTLPDNARPETQWKPWLPQLVYARKYGSYPSGGSTAPNVNTSGWPADIVTPVRHQGNYVQLSGAGDYAACPSAARKLATMTRGNLVSYMNGLKVAGRTYHDIGFLWGLRLLSSTGLFGSENTTASNGSQIARHIIFMTDGQTETNFADYDAYGLAALDRRRTDLSRLPTDSEQDAIVEHRLTALCQAAQGRDTTVWVIAFGTTLTPLLSECASPGAHSFQANNAADLNTAFASIAANLAKLRVSR